MRRLLVFSGAGFSAESGIPVFRGDGLWDEHPVSEVCDIRSFRRNHSLVTTFYDRLRKNMENALPHPGYFSLREIGSHYNTEYFTSNIDDLHEKAALPCTHIHGKISDVFCMECHKFSCIGSLSTMDAYRQGLIRHTDKCQSRRGIFSIKPGITFYNENYDFYPGYERLKTALKTLGHDDVVLVIGSSLDVLPVDYWLRHTRCHKYNINPVRMAGYGRDARHWRNISMPASKGLENLKQTLSQFWG